jgi:hypothetical protein
MSSVSNLVIKNFSNTTRLGHIIMLYLLRKEVHDLFKKIVSDYKITGMKLKELEMIVNSESYIQLEIPTNLKENTHVLSEYIQRVKEYNETLSHSS